MKPSDGGTDAFTQLGFCGRLIYVYMKSVNSVSFSSWKPNPHYFSPEHSLKTFIPLSWQKAYPQTFFSAHDLTSLTLNTLYFSPHGQTVSKNTLLIPLNTVTRTSFNKKLQIYTCKEINYWVIIHNTKDYSPWTPSNVHWELIPCLRAINRLSLMVQRNKWEDWLLQGWPWGGVGPKCWHGTAEIRETGWREHTDGEWGDGESTTSEQPVDIILKVLVGPN